MRRIMMALGLLLLAAAPAEAQQVTGIEITEYGIYTTETISKQTTANGIGGRTVKNIRLAVSTTTVPLQTNVEFGFRYHISGAPEGASVQIRRVFLFPPPGLKPPGKPEAMRRDEDTVSKKIGATSYAGYSLEEPFELVPGKWTFQLWWGNRMMAEQSFTVVAR